jgi:serine protease
MNRKLLLSGVLVLFSFFGTIASNGPLTPGFKLPSGITSNDYVAGTIIFKLKPEYRNISRINGVEHLQLKDVFNKAGVTSVIKKFPSKLPPVAERNAAGLKMADLSLIYELKYNSQQPIEKIINSIIATGTVIYAEPKYIPRLLYTPNDPSTGLQYFLTKIQAYQAWDISTGDTNVVIGITDTGTDLDHPDLAPNLKYNYADPIDGSDNDGDGYIDNYRGWDLGESDNNPSVNASNHGSHVSGCAAAVTDNSSGVASPGFNTRYLPVKISNSAGSLTEAYEGITYAADHGCDIINCSWGGGGGGSFGQDVIDYATINMDALVIAAAGNDNVETQFFPAAYNYVLSIASTGNSDAKSSFSNYGSYIDVCAPGSNIYSTVSNDTYTFMSGTSMAAPVASGAAAIIKAQNPTFNALQIGEQLRVTSDNIYSVPSNGVYLDKLGKGRINMFRSLTETGPSVRMSNIVLTDNNDDAFVIGDTVSITGDITNFLDPTVNLDITITSSSPWITIIDNNTNVGALGTMVTVDNNADPFTLKVNAGTPQNTKIFLKINFSDGGYTDFQVIELIVNVDYINVTINDISTTITSKGRICYNGEGQMEGLGFIYNSTNLVYEAGLMIGQSTSKVSDNVRGAPSTDNDFQSSLVVQRIIPSIASEFDLYGKFTDNISSSPLPVTVTHKAYAWSTPGNRKFVIVEYIIKNTGANTLSNVWAGIFADWDIQDYSLNRADENAALKMGYIYNTQPGGLWAGIKVLTPTPFNHYAIDNVAGQGGVNMTDGYDTNEKYTTLSTARPAAGLNGSGNDVIDVVSTGAFTIAAGDSVKVAFALIGGDDLADINNSATNAQIKYDNLPTSLSGPVLSQNNFYVYPNPAKDQLQITVSEKNIQSVEITDLAGRVVKNIVLTPGMNQVIKTDISTLASGTYLVNVFAGGKILTEKFVKQ